jgi:hypothetical protein
MKPKIIPLLEECIEAGLQIGYNRAHKHIDKPFEEQIWEQQQSAIMGEIFERFDFEELKDV